MTASYELLSLPDVRPGMVLSDVLLDRQGQVLLPDGAVLTAAIIALLPAHGIEMLAVLRADEASLPPAINVAAVQARLDHVFRRQAAATPPADASLHLKHFVEVYRGVREAEQ
jgi:hypothetical protein